jgi:hypothetical protein
MPEYPGDAGKAERIRAVAQLLLERGARRRTPAAASSLDPRVHDQLTAIIPGLVFSAAHIYLRGKSRDSIVAAVESKGSSVNNCLMTCAGDALWAGSRCNSSLHGTAPA